MKSTGKQGTDITALLRSLATWLLAAGIIGAAAGMAAPAAAVERPAEPNPTIEVPGGSIPPTAIKPLRLPAMPLRTQGRWIVDSGGKRVKLASANWYGAESPEHVVGGLDQAALASIPRWLREHGFNSIRLPWSNELVETSPPWSPRSCAMSCDPTRPSPETNRRGAMVTPPPTGSARRSWEATRCWPPTPICW
ncbi:MAG: hypothetical protein ACRDPW_11145 [Mycobacteriales bacterium]